MLLIVGCDEEGGGESGSDAKSADWNLVFGVWYESQPRADGSNMFAMVRGNFVEYLLWWKVGKSRCDETVKRKRCAGSPRSFATLCSVPKNRWTLFCVLCRALLRIAEVCDRLGGCGCVDGVLQVPGLVERRRGPAATTAVGGFPSYEML